MGRGLGPPPTLSAGRGGGDQPGSSLQPGPTLILQLPSRPAQPRERGSRPNPRPASGAECPEVSHTHGPRQGQLGTRLHSAWPQYASQQCARCESGDPCSPSCSGIVGPETASPFLSWVPPLRAHSPSQRWGLPLTEPAVWFSVCFVNWGVPSLFSEGRTAGCWQLARTRTPRAQTVRWAAHAVRWSGSQPGLLLSCLSFLFSERGPSLRCWV